MNWEVFYPWFSLISLLGSAAGFMAQQKLWQRRWQSMRRELERCSEDLSQLVELQSQLMNRIRHDIDDLEAKVMDLAVPSAETPLPLQRRHQVLTLARKGVAVEEIAHRLNMPRGEAELILNLRKYADARMPEPQSGESMKAYARGQIP